ncbi:BlaI/MecI/CopY family transcriptional regulator [Tuwongella immobilis]|uniref:Penicillinase repressor n=1 Tax=Tuwongella immobilis TaxID=692036 RepID=A0A6C2YRU6_9BACT|nr:BlaI/MecI/CopY family transcriptional regulator [Tuwongella immobilis]VIP04081.1 transcriptional regulator : Transcriptional repressor, CopY family OS=Planctomyces brasiliensis (strain ATCC 49424 / DSM 5305 / JCM 21570 / NBRC 103401 / IFAM 1448) GN=Plabr_3893 PE=4 SV=1: Penicillinase_R [Tuwongella immobilis]VTS05529.1 transcriptional regulator : Transcriptional repressor, CopY family OS=Planctomyces brasiliensis (strain ATCC 49424 / DSM 5305 / JCM 21570 / NBRC 103401 / IFAM 1448) GN=Plabr_3893
MTWFRPGDRIEQPNQGGFVEQLPTPTARELEILKVLWEVGPCSVREVHQRLQPADGETLAPNTVQTLIRIMETKGLVSHTVEGRTFIYRAEFTREESTTRFVNRVFDGAASQLVMTLLQNEQLSAGELEQMQRLIDEARRRRLGS